MMKSVDDFKTSLRSLLQGRVCIVGVGNRQRGDDGAGPRLIDLREPDCPGFWLDAGFAPENFLEPIARSRSDTVLIVDAVAFGAVPGEFRLLDEVDDMVATSTHASSLTILAEYLSSRTVAHIRVLAIQPARLTLGTGLSPSIEKSVRKLAVLLADALRQVEQDCTNSDR